LREYGFWIENWLIACSDKGAAQEIRGFEKMLFRMDLKWDITRNVCAARSSGQMSWLKLTQYKKSKHVGNQCRCLRGMYFSTFP